MATNSNTIADAELAELEYKLVVENESLGLKIYEDTYGTAYFSLEKKLNSLT